MCKFVETAGMVKFKTKGAGVGVGEIVGVGVMVGVGEIVGVGELVGVGDRVGVGEFVGVGVLVGVGDRVGVGDDVGDRDKVGETAAIGLADSLLFPDGVNVASEESLGFSCPGVPIFPTVIELKTSADGLEKEPDSIDTKKHKPVTVHPISMRRNFFIFDESSVWFWV